MDDDDQANGSENLKAADSAPLWVTYSPRSSCQYQTRTQGDNVMIDGQPQPQPSSKSMQLVTHSGQTTEPRESVSETFFESFASKSAISNRLLAYLLGATLFASFLNTFLLSFVVKSLQLNNRGFINEKLTWDEQTNSTLLQLLARVSAGKSISTKAIESFGDKAVRLDINHQQVGGDGADTQHGDGVATVSGSPANRNRDRSAANDGSFLIAGPTRQQRASDDYLASQESDRSAANPSGQSRLGTSELGGELEISANSLVLDVTDDEVDGFSAERNDDEINNLQPRREQKADIVAHELRQLSSGKMRRRLLDFDSKLGTISLPLEDRLNLNSAQTNSLVVDHSLGCSDIKGSLEHNLDVQTRDANLICKSGATLRLMAKSGSVKMAAFEELVLSAKSLVMRSPKKLYIPNGIQYFDSELADEMSQQQVGSRHLSVDELSAYNLVVVNGILMGST